MRDGTIENSSYASSIRVRPVSLCKRQTAVLMDRRARLESALFGIRGGEVWISDEAFITQQNDGLLVERWVGTSVISVLVRPGDSACMASVWAKLSARLVEP